MPPHCTNMPSTAVPLVRHATATQANKGCGILAAENTYGTPFNVAKGGVFATVWNSTTIASWFFPRSAIPADINAHTPNPDAWGKPYALFELGDNCPARDGCSLSPELSLPSACSRLLRIDGTGSPLLRPQPLPRHSTRCLTPPLAAAAARARTRTHISTRTHPLVNICKASSRQIIGCKCTNC
jgi:hypothetical protein